MSDAVVRIFHQNLTTDVLVGFEFRGKKQAGGTSKLKLSFLYTRNRNCQYSNDWIIIPIDLTLKLKETCQESWQQGWILLVHSELHCSRLRTSNRQQFPACEVLFPIVRIWNNPGCWACIYKKYSLFEKSFTLIGQKKTFLFDSKLSEKLSLYNCFTFLHFWEDSAELCHHWEGKSQFLTGLVYGCSFPSQVSLVVDLYLVCLLGSPSHPELRYKSSHKFCQQHWEALVGYFHCLNHLTHGATLVCLANFRNRINHWPWLGFNWTIFLYLWHSTI